MSAARRPLLSRHPLPAFAAPRSATMECRHPLLSLVVVIGHPLLLLVAVLRRRSRHSLSSAASTPSQLIVQPTLLSLILMYAVVLGSK